MRRSWALGISAVVASIVMVGATLAGDPVESGLKVGDQVSPFDVDDVTGPNKGRTLCYRWRYGSSPVVCVFARKTSEPLASLVKQIDKKIGDNRKLKSFVVISGGEPDKLKDELRKFAKDNNIEHVPLTMFGDPDGPGDYELSRKADVTVTMWQNHRVKVSRGFKGDLTDKDIEAVAADVSKLLGE